MITEKQIEEIRDRKLCIFAMIRFNNENFEKLKQLMFKISPTSRINNLTKRDVYFSYCKYRDIWYGSEISKNYYLPSIQLTDL